LQTHLGERAWPVLTGEIDKKLPLNGKDELKEKLAKRQTNAAVALLRMNEPAEVWPLLKHSPDPRVRSYLLHRLSPLGAEAKVIVKRLDEEPDLTIRRALILRLGEFGAKDFTVDNRNALLPKLHELYCEHGRDRRSCRAGFSEFSLSRSAYSQVRAYAHHRSAVGTDTPRAFATSGIVMPAKKRSTTNSALRGPAGCIALRLAVVPGCNRLRTARIFCRFGCDTCRLKRLAGLKRLSNEEAQITAKVIQCSRPSRADAPKGREAPRGVTERDGENRGCFAAVAPHRSAAGCKRKPERGQGTAIFSQLRAVGRRILSGASNPRDCA